MSADFPQIIILIIDLRGPKKFTKFIEVTGTWFFVCKIHVIWNNKSGSK